MSKDNSKSAADGRGGAAGNHKNTVWVLLEEYNDYNQHGSYLVAAWRSKPSPERLLAAGVNEHDVEHVSSGGGRLGKEDQWWVLEQLLEGQRP